MLPKRLLIVILLICAVIFVMRTHGFKERNNQIISIMNGE